jgi:hypothetical protein
MTRTWQLVRNADELLEYSKIAGDALFAIRILRLQRQGLLAKDDLAENINASITKASELLQGVVDDLTYLESGNIKHVMLVKLLGNELSLNDVKALKNVVSQALQELQRFIEEKRNEAEHAEEILETIENASRRGVLESIASLTFLQGSFH